MIRESFRTEEECGYGKLTIKQLHFLSIEASIDAFATGISFSLLSINIWPVVILIATITFLMSLGWAYFRCNISEILKNRAEQTDGIILVFTGLKILFEGLI